MPLTTGQMLQNRYRVVSRLGQGGMGAVYYAWDTRLELYVAIKELRPQPGLDPHILSGLRQQFQQEATTLARLNHPHLVRVSDFFEQAGNVYLVMDFVEGESLAERIERQRNLPESQVVAWGDQLLDALAYCHAQGVFHRDVKPQNVIIGPDGRVTLVDFGLVKLWDPLDPYTRTAMRGMGTPEYAPPEQYDSGRVYTDARSDIYSVGATLYHALGGQAPPTATRRIVSPGALVPLRELSPQVGPAVEAVVMQALALRPEARFQSAAEMRRALSDAVRPAPAPSLVASGAAPTAQVGSLAQRPMSARPHPSQAAGRQTSPWMIVGFVGGSAVLLVAALIILALAKGWLLGDNRPGGERPAPSVLTETVEGSGSPVVEALTPTGAAPLAATERTETPASTPLTTDTPEPTATGLPTDTPAPTDTPISTDTPTPTDTVTPECPSVGGPFAEIWESNREKLGCATNDARLGWIAEEAFERGRTFWREDTKDIVVLYNSGSWAAYQDTWKAGDPDYSCPESAPAETPPTPIRGFGKVWCSHEAVRDGLGWATTVERGFNATLQDFGHGWIIRTDDGRTYMGTDDGNWESP